MTRNFEMVEEVTDRAHEALKAGESPYLTLLFIIAPLFRGPDEAEIQVFEQDDTAEGAAPEVEAKGDEVLHA